jgi:ubiquinone/menaquinone biosynthesis C-methylase UbiE
MSLSPADWHNRFTLQAQWTSNTRDYLFQIAGIHRANNVLDVGCGTGILTRQIRQFEVEHAVGIDIDTRFTALAAAHNPENDFVAADALALPFPHNTFDCSFCHYVLMWVADPLRVLVEMARVTKPGEAVLALAEPDYGGRIDHPQELELINQWQTRALQIQGANPYFGRRLKDLFHRAGLIDIQVGVIGAQWKNSPSKQELESEWRVIQHDLHSLEKENSEILEISEEMMAIDYAAWANGQRILYVPTFYALGRVPLS